MKQKHFMIGLFLSVVAAVLLVCAYGAITQTGPFAKVPDAPPGFLDQIEGKLPAPGNEETPDEEPEDPFPMYDRGKDETFIISGRELLPAAIACEMDLNAPEEALKAQAVACYTLFCRKRDSGEAIACDPDNWQVWTDEAHMRERWGQDFESTLAALEQIVDEVYGETLTWEGEPILAAYTAISNGSTEDGALLWKKSYPYLKPAASPGDCFADGFLSTVSLTEEEFRERAKAGAEAEEFSLEGEPDGWLTELTHTSRGTVETGRLGGVTLTGQQLRTIFRLPSASFTVEHSEEGFVFTVRGRGHGVGMSQAGAVFFAKRGMGYEDILAHYYPGTELKG